MKGKIIVLEGTDAVGKRTQAGLLAESLRRKGRKVKIINFPTYESTFGRLIKEYLHGNMGFALPLEMVATLYALDRYQYKDSLFSALKSGEILVMNRYVQSNLYQAAKIPGRKERDKFIEWMHGMESRLPAADVVVFLNLPISISEKLLLRRGDRIDVNEKDRDYQERVRKIYLSQAKKHHWMVVECAKGGRIRNKDEIASEILQKIQSRI
ncbi:MAG: deoxynucleoside kinase [Candidatus Micrarchaeota archaeon]